MERASVRTRGLLGTAALVTAYAVVTALLLWGTAGALTAVRDPGPAAADALVALLAAGAAWLVLSWLTAVTLLALVSAAVGGLGSRAHAASLALAPAFARRAVAAVLGMAVAGVPIAGGLPAGADERPATVATAGTATGLDLDRPAATAPPAGWTPDRPATTHRRDASTETAIRLVSSPPHAEHGVADEVVVRRGDTLWDIATRHLGPDSGAAEVAAEWPRWYAANRGVIGEDPDLLLPGQRLVAPSA